MSRLLRFTLFFTLLFFCGATLAAETVIPTNKLGHYTEECVVVADVDGNGWINVQEMIVLQLCELRKEIEND